MLQSRRDGGGPVAQIFFGYPERPRRLAETMRNTATALTEHDCVTWQSLAVGGRVVMRAVLEAIDDADFAIFDATYPNENVLFEAGYAVARAKPVWLTLDTTIANARKNWAELGLLNQIGYVGYRNSWELSGRVRADNPAETLTSLYDELIEQAMPEGTSSSTLLYCPPFEPFEAANGLSTLIAQQRRRGLQVVSADPTESSLEPLTWYAEKLGNAAGILINFAGRSRNLAELHNRRNAFVAGLAIGFEIPLLMLSEDDYAPPFDYEELLHVYETAAACLSSARSWLADLEVGGRRIVPRAVVQHSRLAGLRFGEHVAENELPNLEDYFVRTAAFEDVLLARDALFVGHRGSGKTASALQAFEEIAANKENLALLIKPASFEFPSLLATLDRVPVYTHDYLFDTLWRFLVQTELAAKVFEQLKAQPVYIPLDEGERAFLAYVKAAPFDIRADMSVRLDQALKHVLNAVRGELGVESGRVLINEAFHQDALVELRNRLGPVLRDRRRVAVLIDNLDKGWQRQARLDVLARLILGLLSARGQLVTDFARQDSWRDEIRLTMAIFLRSDIYTHVRAAAREPDKLSPSTIVWRDPRVLESVLEERLQSGWSNPGRPPGLWGDVFCPEVSGRSTKEYVFSRVLPRPRDLVYWANAAVARAVDRRLNQVGEEEVRAALSMYSQYAYEALLVENGITIPEMDAVLYAFLGESSIITRGRIVELLNEAGVIADKHEATLVRLVEMSFLGFEVSEGIFEYPEIGTELGRAAARARRLEPDKAVQRFEIHPAFRDFLMITAPACT